MHCHAGTPRYTVCCTVFRYQSRRQQRSFAVVPQRIPLFLSGRYCKQSPLTRIWLDKLHGWQNIFLGHSSSCIHAELTFLELKLGNFIIHLVQLLYPLLYMKQYIIPRPYQIPTRPPNKILRPGQNPRPDPAATSTGSSSFFSRVISALAVSTLCCCL